MDYVITRNVLESDKDLFVSKNGFAWTTSPPKNILTYDVEYKERNCVRTILHLSGVDIQQPPEFQCYKNALSKFNEKIPLGVFMPADLYKNYVKSIVLQIDSNIENRYYHENFVKYDMIFDSLSQALINKTKLQYYASQKANLSNTHVLASFLPDENLLAKKVRYDRVTSRTGRLKVESGPSILTLKKEQRDIISSRYKNGKILSIDYSNLESRVFLYSAGVEIDSSDIYAFIAKKIFNDEYPRNVIKTIVISLLYGMGDIAMAVKLDLDKTTVKKLSKKIKNFFKYDDLFSKLENKVENDRIKNHYGRSIAVPDMRLLLNTYVQSSAVDVVMHGFSKMINSMPKSGFTPLFVLHDALIVDVEEGCDLSFASAGESVPMFDGVFPVHISDF